MKILHFIYGLHVGGAETFIGNEICNLSSEDYKFDFAIQDPSITNEILRKYIADHDSKVYILPKYSKPISQFNELKKILRAKDYDFVHVHMNSAVNPVPLIISNLIRNKTRFVFHSHSSTNNNGGKIGWLLHKFNTKLFIRNNSYKVACSEVAGRWMFGKKAKFVQINNSICAHQFQYNIEDRKKIREEMNLPSKAKVIGSVGRFVAAKNHKFMIECFAEIYKRNKDTYLLLVGEGGLLESTKNLVSDLRIADRVIFTGLRTDIPTILSAMDCFLMPSLYEGLAFTAIEAQANGLRIIASDTITPMINVKDYCKFLSLESPLDSWCDEIEKVLEESEKFDRSYNPVKGSMFDVPVMVKQVKELYK